MAKMRECDCFDRNDYAADDDENHNMFADDHQLIS